MLQGWRLRIEYSRNYEFFVNGSICENTHRTEETMKDYKSYRLNLWEKAICVILTFGITALVSWLFYRSIYGLTGVLPLFFLVKKQWKNYLYRRQKKELLYHFREMLLLTAGALKAGSSMENAFLQGWQEYKQLYGDKTVMAQEFENMIRRMQLNVPLEQLMEDLAQRSGIEEIVGFVQVFGFAKRSGGDMMKIFQDTVEKIRQKTDVEREIETVIAAKKTEQRIMDLVPFGILFYVGTASPEFLEPLYGNWPGALVMTVCLLGYAGAFFLSEKILDIQV